MIEVIPLDKLVVAAAIAAVFVGVIVEMLKAVGVKGQRRTSAAALAAGQAILLPHWWVAWPHTPESLFLAVLTGLAASAMAMKIWDKIVKPHANTSPPT